MGQDNHRGRGQGGQDARGQGRGRFQGAGRGQNKKKMPKMKFYPHGSSGRDGTMVTFNTVRDHIIDQIQKSY